MLLPLIVFGIFYFIPVAEELKQTLFVLFSCPIASVTLNYAEMVGKGQNEAANLVLLSVILSVVTLPVLLYNFTYCKKGRRLPPLLYSGR